MIPFLYSQLVFSAALVFPLCLVANLGMSWFKALVRYGLRVKGQRKRASIMMLQIRIAGTLVPHGTYNSTRARHPC